MKKAILIILLLSRYGFSHAQKENPAANGKYIRTMSDSAHQMILQKDMIKARVYLERAANAGDAESVYLLGHLYANAFTMKDGTVLQPDYDKATLWLGRAAATNNPGAMAELGKIYQYNKQDTATAAGWYRKLSALGYIEGELLLGDITHDYTKVIKILTTQITANNNAEDMETLGDVYALKLKDYRNAVLWYNKAAKAGNRDAAGKAADAQKKLENPGQ